MSRKTSPRFTNLTSDVARPNGLFPARANPILNIKAANFRLAPARRNRLCLILPSEREAASGPE
jgi:hypothetical protein